MWNQTHSSILSSNYIRDCFLRSDINTLYVNLIRNVAVTTEDITHELQELKFINSPKYCTSDQYDACDFLLSLLLELENDLQDLDFSYTINVERFLECSSSTHKTVSQTTPEKMIRLPIDDNCNIQVLINKYCQPERADEHQCSVCDKYMLRKKYSNSPMFFLYNYWDSTNLEKYMPK